jgi:hypothetical protein
MDGKTIARFWSKVEKRGPDECWEWKLAKDRDGYGVFSVGPGHGRQHRANRVAWGLTHGPIAAGLCVCHRCDNRGCCSPAHLFLGTNAENSRDRDAKGRLVTSRGNALPQAKLTPESVAEIRQLLGTGVAQEAVGRRFGVTQGTISFIARGKTWAHV